MKESKSVDVYVMALINILHEIEPQIRQNERERTASMHAASRCIVGGK